MLGVSKRRSAEKKATIEQEIMPRVKWKASNFPERRIQRTNMIKKVRRKGMARLRALEELEGCAKSLSW
jgi:hypothetical protein